VTDGGLNWREVIRRSRALVDDPTVDAGLRAALREKLAELDRIVAWFRAAAAPDDLPSFTCPVCCLTSYHPEDVEHGYCGSCHAYTAEPFWSAEPSDPRGTSPSSAHDPGRNRP
jgi:hypothetical protein